MLSEGLLKKYATTLKMSPELILDAVDLPVNKQDFQELKQLAFLSFMELEANRMLAFSQMSKEDVKLIKEKFPHVNAGQYEL